MVRRAERGWFIHQAIASNHQLHWQAKGIKSRTAEQSASRIIRLRTSTSHFLKVNPKKLMYLKPRVNVWKWQGFSSFNDYAKKCKTKIDQLHFIPRPLPIKFSCSRLFLRRSEFKTFIIRILRQFMSHHEGSEGKKLWQWTEFLQINFPFLHSIFSGQMNTISNRI